MIQTHMSEKPLNWEIHFTLSEKIDCEDKLPTIKGIDIETSIGKANQKSITGFNIKVENTTESIAIETTSKKAQIFTDLLSITSGTASAPRQDRTRVEKSTREYRVSRTLTSSYNNKNNADLNISEKRLENILENRDAELTQQMKHVNRATNAIKNGDPASAIKDLVLACNQDPKGTLAKYRSLRNALNHDPVFKKDIQNIQRDFGPNYFEFTSEDMFDYISDQNLENLTTETNSFLKQVREDIKKRFRDTSHLT